METDQADRRVIIGKGLPASGILPQLISLPQPQNGAPATFVPAGGCLQEINWFKAQHSSWFSNNTVISDGGLFLCTEVDPLFLSLPFLEASRQKSDGGEGLFQDAEQIFQAVAMPGGERSGEILRGVAEPHLRLICDAKEACGDTYYRLSDRKVLAWLKCKTQRVVGCLVASGGVFAGMDRSAVELYAVGLLGEYLNPQLAAALKAAYAHDAPEVQEVVECNPLAEVTNSREAQGDFKRPEKKIKLDPKVLARQKAQEVRDEKRSAQMKRETAGMKKMSSFFARK